MQFDLSAVDTELDALGSEAAEALQLAERYAGPIKSLADADAALATLGQPLSPASPVPALSSSAGSASPSAASSVPPPPSLPPSLAHASDGAPLELSSDELAEGLAGLEAMAPSSATVPPPPSVSERTPQSGELALPEPVKRPDPTPISGELDLAAADPTSGSFALPESEPATEQHVFTAPEQTNEAKALEAPAPIPSEAPEVQIDEVPDDDAEALFAEFDSIPAAPTPAALKNLGDLSLEPPPNNGRDPDAEFDAIFSDATSPQGIPTRAFAPEDDDTPSAEELLTGLEASSEALDPEDRTEILDSKTLGFAANADADALHEEVTDLEILMEEDLESEAESPPPKNSPPPPPRDSLNKPPSFLNRLFGRKDQPPSE